jgi:hypothetical protein
MHLLRLTSIFFLLGLLVSKLFGATAIQSSGVNDGPETRIFKVQSFNKIYLEGAYRVVLKQGKEAGLSIKTDQDNFEFLDVESDESTLSLKIEKDHLDFDDMTLYITFVKLEKVVIEGGIQLETDGYVDLDDFYLHVEGGAIVEMNMKVNQLKVIGEGGVKFEFDGIAKTMDARISGAGYLDADDLKARQVTCKIEGVGAASVYASESLDAFISGVGKINYEGNPKVNKQINGIGVVSND